MTDTSPWQARQRWNELMDQLIELRMERLEIEERLDCFDEPDMTKNRRPEFVELRYRTKRVQMELCTAARL